MDARVFELVNYVRLCYSSRLFEGASAHLCEAVLLKSSFPGGKAIRIGELCEAVLLKSSFRECKCSLMRGCATKVVLSRVQGY